MKYICPLIVVDDIDKSKKFYENVLGQKVLFDHGQNVAFESGLSIHLKTHFSQLIDVDPGHIAGGSNNFELYFEEEDLDAFLEKLKGVDNLKYLHPLREQPWGQRVIRFYDPDMHIIEVGEPMEVVAKRFLSMGMSVEETSERISMPKEFVKMCL